MCGGHGMARTRERTWNAECGWSGEAIFVFFDACRFKLTKPDRTAKAATITYAPV